MNMPFSPELATVRDVDLRSAEDRARFDAYVRAHPEGSPFHLTAWLTAVEKGCGQKAHALVAEASGVVVGVLPLIEMRSILFGKALVSSGFAVDGGMLSDTPQAQQALADAAWALAQARGCPSIELRSDSAPADWQRKADVYSGFIRPIAADDEAELLAIPRKQRAEVRRALGFNLQVETGQGERDRRAHYTVYAESVRNLGTPVFPRALFDAVLDAFGDEADILTVRHKGRAIASVLSLYFNGAVMPYWGGGTADARRWRANDLMYYALMGHARARGCTRFDFGRSKVGTGAWSFKKNWGFEPTPLTYALRTADGAPPREINPLSPKYRLQVAAWRKLPLPIANFLGPFLSRGLG